MISPFSFQQKSLPTSRLIFVLSLLAKCKKQFVSDMTRKFGISFQHYCKFHFTVVVQGRMTQIFCICPLCLSLFRVDLTCLSVWYSSFGALVGIWSKKQRDQAKVLCTKFLARLVFSFNFFVLFFLLKLHNILNANRDITKYFLDFLKVQFQMLQFPAAALVLI